jgi:murein DD-endopeptidase MepM/ murein hydrolase activator NlpD
MRFPFQITLVRALGVALVVALLVLAAAVAVILGSGSQPSSVAVVSPTPVPSASAPPTAAGVTLGPSPSSAVTPSAGPSASPTPVAVNVKNVTAHSLDPGQLTGYLWPVHNALITSRFAPRPADEGGFVLIDGVAYHDGLDIATYCNDRVYAAHDGTVLYAGREFDPFFGYWGDAAAIDARYQRLNEMNTLPIVIVIDDDNGYRSVYVHLAKAIVEAGDTVKAGDTIGREGMTGYATGCHLHYGLIRMDGTWQPVVPRLLQYDYPAYVRERVNPLDVLPWADPYAPLKLREKVGAVPSPSPTLMPSPTATPLPSPSVSTPSPSATPIPSG